MPAGDAPFSRLCAGLYSDLAQTPSPPTTLPVLFDLLIDELCKLSPHHQCSVVFILQKAIDPNAPEEVRQRLISSFPVIRPMNISIEGDYYHLHDNKIHWP